MKYIIIIAILLFITGCAAPKIYKTSDVTCTWSDVSELIICTGAPK